MFGGVAIYLAFLLTFLFTGPHAHAQWVLLLGGSAVFAVGLIDDARELKPQVKFLAQLIVAIVAVSQGVSLDAEIIPWPWLSIPLAVFWLVGVTNAVNILDNMDGLAAGVVFVASAALAVGSVLNNFPEMGPLSRAFGRGGFGVSFYTTSTRPASSWAIAAPCFWASP